MGSRYPCQSEDERMSLRAESAIILTKVHYRDVMRVLWMIMDEYSRSDGGQRKGCHVCLEVHKMRYKMECMFACL